MMLLRRMMTMWLLRAMVIHRVLPPPSLSSCWWCCWGGWWRCGYWELWWYGCHRLPYPFVDIVVRRMLMMLPMRTFHYPVVDIVSLHLALFAVLALRLFWNSIVWLSHLLSFVGLFGKRLAFFFINHIWHFKESEKKRWAENYFLAQSETHYLQLSATQTMHLAQLAKRDNYYVVERPHVLVFNIHPSEVDIKVWAHFEFIASFAAPLLSSSVSLVLTMVRFCTFVTPSIILSRIDKFTQRVVPALGSHPLPNLMFF